MKKVTYLNQEFTVPDWATHIAADDDGAVYATDRMPVRANQNTCWRPRDPKDMQYYVGELNVHSFHVQVL
jgi:hypothetical protein